MTPQGPPADVLARALWEMFCKPQPEAVPEPKQDEKAA